MCGKIIWGAGPITFFNCVSNCQDKLARDLLSLRSVLCPQGRLKIFLLLRVGKWESVSQLWQFPFSLRVKILSMWVEINSPMDAKTLLSAKPLIAGGKNLYPLLRYCTLKIPLGSVTQGDLNRFPAKILKDNCVQLSPEAATL